MPTRADGLLPRTELDHLRTALAGFTVDSVRELIGPSGRSALDRGDLDGVARALPDGERLSKLTRLFLLGRPVAAREARRILAPLLLDGTNDLLELDGDEVRATVEVRPYAEAGTSGPEPWWVVSDFGSDVRPGPLQPDHVLGVGAASLSLAQATIRTPTARALDLGTGCGIQALHLSRHTDEVVVTDTSARALRLAATTAALSGVAWQPRQGSLLDPVAGERFDHVVANPPFVVSPGLDAAGEGYDYRDSGLAGDAVCATLVAGIPGVLAPGGSASLLANWIIDAETPWDERVAGWLEGTGCDAWIWQREIAEPGEYVALWLRDAGEQPGTPRWRSRYERWRDWFDQAGVLAVGMGVVTLWRPSDDSGSPVVVCEDVPQAVEQPAGAYLPAWIERQRWLRAADDAALFGARLRLADGVVCTRSDLVRPGAGWSTERTTLRQSYGARWELEADDAIVALAAGCDGETPLLTLAALVAAGAGAGVDDVIAALVPVVRDLVGRGFLEPVIGGSS